MTSVFPETYSGFLKETENSDSALKNYVLDFVASVPMARCMHAKGISIWKMSTKHLMLRIIN